MAATEALMKTTYDTVCQSFKSDYESDLLHKDIFASGVFARKDNATNVSVGESKTTIVLVDGKLLKTWVYGNFV